MMDINLTDPKRGALSMQQFKDCDGIIILIKLMKKMVEDATFVQLAIQVLELVKTSVPLMMDFIQFGGLDLLEKAIRVHSKDDIIAIEAPKCLKYIVAVGAKVTVAEIKNEEVNLQLCSHCAEIIERAKRPKFSTIELKIPKSSDRINRVLKFMDNYIQRVDVVIAGLDAVVTYTKNPDASSTIRDSTVFTVLGRAYTSHSQNTAIIWRLCLAFSIIAMLNPESAADIARLDIHESMVTNFKAFLTQPIAQQQILNLFAAYIRGGPKSRTVIHKSKVVMDFLKEFISTRDEAYNAEQLKRRAEDDDIKHFEIAIPLAIRTFIRETKGEVLVEGGKKKKATIEVKQRRNFSEKPAFGTVTDIYAEGEAGLISGGPEEMAAKSDQQEKDWEVALTYGKKKK